MEQIPYIVFESEMARHERTIKRLLILLVISVLLLFISNVAWLWFFNQFDVETQTVSQELDSGNANFIGNNGAITNGTSGSKDD